MLQTMRGVKSIRYTVSVISKYQPGQFISLAEIKQSNCSKGKSLENVLINDQEMLHLSAFMWTWQQGNPAKKQHSTAVGPLALLSVESNWAAQKFIQGTQACEETTSLPFVDRNWRKQHNQSENEPRVETEGKQGGRAGAHFGFLVTTGPISYI